MNKFNGFRKVFLTVALCFVFSTTAFASPDNTPPYRGHGQETITRDLTAEEKKAAIEKENYVRALQSKKLQDKANNAYSTASTTSVRLLIVPQKQEQTNYCGPASALAIIDYRWATPSQDYLADIWDPQKKKYGMNTIKNNGTTTPDMVRSINHNAAITSYISSKTDDSSMLWFYITFDLDNDYPLNILVDTKHLSWYKGKSLNHFVTVFGYSDNGTTKKVDIADPHYSNTYYGEHLNESYTNVFNAVKAQSWRENVAW